MTNVIDNGGPAFPRQGVAGMSLRDYFAGQALGGAIANATGLETLTKSERKEAFRQTAELLYEVADAMIEARK